MTIKIGNSDAHPYKGDYRPINVYKGTDKLAGWRWATTSGIALAQYQTDYKDTAQVSLDGNSIQPLSFREETGKTLTLTNHGELSLRKLEVYGESYQVVTDNSPSPDYPSPISNVSDVGIYSGATPMPVDTSGTPLDTTTNNTYLTKPTLTAPLRKVGDVADRLFYDKMANKFKVERRVAVTGLDDGTQTIAQAYSPLATPIIETLPDGTLPPLFKPTTYLDTTSTLKGDIKAGYQLATTATPLETDIKVAPEYVNPIVSVSSVDIVSSVGSRNLLDVLPDTHTPTLYHTQPTLSAPLRGGDVKDRLYRDVDGLWKVERKIWSEVLDGTKGLSTSGHISYDGAISTNRWHTTLYEPKFSYSNLSDCSHLSRVSYVWIYDNNGGSVANVNKQFHLRFPNYLTGILNSDSTATRTTKMIAYVKAQYDNGTPVMIKYNLATPTLETLPQADQDKLNAIPTYRGENYVYTVSNVEPSGIKVDYKVRDI